MVVPITACADGTVRATTCGQTYLMTVLVTPASALPDRAIRCAPAGNQLLLGLSGTAYQPVARPPIPKQISSGYRLSYVPR